MEIFGPLKIKMLDIPKESTREIHISFAEDFKTLTHDQRIKAFANYLAELKNAGEQTKEDSAEAEGVAIIFQFCEQVFPYIHNNELDLEATMIGSVAQNTSLSALEKYKLRIDGPVNSPIV